MGATLEIQRVQQAEAMEQQLLRARNRYNVVSTGGAGGGSRARNKYKVQALVAPQYTV